MKDDVVESTKSRMALELKHDKENPSTGSPGQTNSSINGSEPAGF